MDGKTFKAAAAQAIAHMSNDESQPIFCWLSDLERRFLDGIDAPSCESATPEIEVTHRFDATHQHMTPRGMAQFHDHNWVWTVRLAGPLDPVFGWVADFDAVRATMTGCTADRYVGTAEQILVGLVAALARELTVSIVWARLEEKPGQAAIWESPG